MTTMTQGLTPAQVEAYERDGILFPVPVLTPAALRRYRGAFDDLAARLGGKAQAVRQPQHHFRWAYDLATEPAVVEAAAAVLGPDVVVHSAIIFCKEPDGKGFVSWHQDGLYKTLRAPHLTSAWIALADSTVESGCMRVIPGTHTQGTVAHKELVTEDNMLRNGQTVEDVDEDRAVDMVLRAGEMSLHHGDIIHGSNPNRSQHRRIGFIVRLVTPAVESVNHPVIHACGEGDVSHLDLLQPPSADPEAGLASFLASR